MNGIALCSALLLAALATACTSAREETMENHEQVSEAMASTLIHQLEERSDLRRLRVTVQPFSDATGASKTRVHRGKVYFNRTETPSEFRLELIEALAPRLRVIDAKSGLTHIQPDTDSNADRHAVLVGEYSANEDDTVYLRTRVIDLENNVVLATAEGIVRK